MRRFVATAFVVLVAIALAPLARADREPSVGACIRSWGEARYIPYGYNHIVHVADGCDAAAECVVSTDVNPEPQNVVVPGHSEIEVITFVASPSRLFVPRVTCKMQSSSAAWSSSARKRT